MFATDARAPSRSQPGPHTQPVQSPDDHAGAPHGIARELEVVEAVEDRGEHRLGLHAGEVLAETGMDAGAELEVATGVGAGDIDVVDSRPPLRLVAVGRARRRVDNGS